MNKPTIKDNANNQCSEMDKIMNHGTSIDNKSHHNDDDHAPFFSSCPLDHEDDAAGGDVRSSSSSSSNLVVEDYSTIFPTNKMKLQIRSSEPNIGKIYATAVDLISASSALFLEELVKKSSQLYDAPLTMDHGDGQRKKRNSKQVCVLTKERLWETFQTQQMIQEQGKEKKTCLRKDKEETCYSFLCLDDIEQSASNAKILAKYGKPRQKPPRPRSQPRLPQHVEMDEMQPGMSHHLHGRIPRQKTKNDIENDEMNLFHLINDREEEEEEEMNESTKLHLGEIIQDEDEYD